MVNDELLPYLKRMADTAADALQGLPWRNVILRAWLCEKRGHEMEQSAGPIDRRTGNAIPAPGHLMRMTPALARRIGCAPFPQPLPSPPFPPQYGTTFVPVVAPNAGTGLPYLCSPQAYLMSTYDLQMVGHFPEMTPPLSHTSRTSSSSTLSTAFLPESAHPRFRDNPILPGTPLVSQAASSSGCASASGASSISTTPRRPSSAVSNQSNDPSHAQGITGYNKIKIQNFNTKANVEELQHFLECTLQLYIVRTKTCKGNGRNSRVFITFHTDRDAEIAVQKLNGFVLSGSELCVSLDLQRGWDPLAVTGKSSTGSVQNPLPVRRIGSGKSSSTAMGKNDINPKPARKEPVIIDGS